jgi:hypothetical protein
MFQTSRNARQNDRTLYKRNHYTADSQVRHVLVQGTLVWRFKALLSKEWGRPPRRLGRGGMFRGRSNIVKLVYSPRNIITFVNTLINIYKSVNYVYFKHEKGCSLHARARTHTHTHSRGRARLKSLLTWRGSIMYSLETTVLRHCKWLWLKGLLRKAMA